MGRLTSLLLLVLLLASPALSNLRFADDQMMKTHHSQKYTGGADLTVHLIPHSHDDVGWLKTVDDYFYGANMRIQFAGVVYTIDTVVTELADHPEYKFTIVEMAFLYRWWNQATDKERQTMKELVQKGQLHFVNAGWCMSDEAAIYYEDFIDQMTVGLRWLKDTFNYVPTVGWHIDPFGHHSSSASLFSQMGFNSFFFARIDYQDKQWRMQKKALQMIWRPYQYTNDKSTYIFTHVNYYHYSPPPGFCFDDVCRDDPIMDDPTLEGYNIDVRAKQFADYFKAQANHFRSTNLMHTMGEDFTYTNSRMWYKNMDKLIKYINDRSQFGVKILYSTPGQYIEAVHKEEKSYPVKNDDFFPYSDNEHSMWTGYFTSRTALKGFVRDFSRFAQSARKHLSELKISNASNTVSSSAKQIQNTVFGMEAALGILQHHDAVSGTAKQHVTDDYIATGLRAIEAFAKLYRRVKAEEIAKETGETVSADDLYINLFWNESGKATGLSKRLESGDKVLVSLYNPGAAGTYPIRLRVPAKDLNVVDHKNQPVKGDVVCSNFKDSSDCELLFSLSFSQGSNSYVKISTSGTGSAKIVPVKELTVVEQIKQFTLGSDKVRFTRGNQSFDLTAGGVTDTFKIFYNYYEAYQQDGQKSGAYIFRPKTDTSKPYSTVSKMHYADGQTVGMIILQGDRATTNVYFNKQDGYVRNFGFLVETHLESIPVSDNIGKEVTLNLKTNFNNNRAFYTDSMGLQSQSRKLDYRPTWNYTVFEPVAGNYYPVNAFIGIKDATSGRSFTVVTDRSQGGSVMRQGQIEIMLNRRLLMDDARGVGEPLNQLDADKDGIRQVLRHNVVIGKNQQYRAVQMWNDRRILPIFGTSKTDSFSNVNIRAAPISVPETVKLYLRPFEDGSYLLRVHNMNPSEKKTVSIDSGWTLTEYTLAANQLLKDWKAKQMTWNEEKTTSADLLNKAEQIIEDISENIGRKLKGSANLVSSDSATQIELREFEIRTFKLTKA